MADSHITAKATFDFNGQTFTLSPITISDLKELENFLRGLPFQVVQQLLVGLDADSRHYVLDKAYDNVKNSPIRIANEEFNKALQTPEGALHLFYIALRHNHPSIDKSTCAEMLQSDQREIITHKLLEVSGMGDGEKKVAAPATTG